MTTLTDGEGKFREIAMVVSYSLTPLIIALIPATIIGNLVVENEEAFYFIIIWIAIAWFAALLFMGTVSVHDYTVTKTVATIFLTFAAMLVIIFLYAFGNNAYPAGHNAFCQYLYRIDFQGVRRTEC